MSAEQPQADNRVPTRRCENCRFAQASPSGWEQWPGTCRRQPPALVPQPEDVSSRLVQQQGWSFGCITVFPVVQRVDWCGAHEPGAPQYEDLL